MPTLQPPGAIPAHGRHRFLKLVWRVARIELPFEDVLLTPFANIVFSSFNPSSQKSPSDKSELFLQAFSGG